MKKRLRKNSIIHLKTRDPTLTATPMIKDNVIRNGPPVNPITAIRRIRVRRIASRFRRIADGLLVLAPDIASFPPERSLKRSTGCCVCEIFEDDSVPGIPACILRVVTTA